MKRPYVFSFTTGFSSSKDPPVVLRTIPSYGARDIPLWTSISIVFSKTMNFTSIDSAIILSPAIAYTLHQSIPGDTFLISPTKPLQSGTRYKVTITAAAMCVFGLYLEKDYIFEFTTMVPATPPAQGTVPSTAVVVGTIAAAVLIATALSLEWVFYGIALLLVPLYIRLRKEQVMDNFLRGKIYQYIKDHPGAHLRMIKREMDVAMGVVCYHLKVLDESKMVLSKNEGYRKKYYAIPKIKPTLGQTLTEIQKKIIKALSHRPGLRAITLSRYLKIEHIAAMDNLRVLDEMGFVRPRQTSRGARYYLSEDRSISDESTA
jgi:predicted transcriptional regulator